jgi:hypothetical protein
MKHFRIIKFFHAQCILFYILIFNTIISLNILFKNHYHLILYRLQLILIYHGHNYIFHYISFILFFHII